MPPYSPKVLRRRSLATDFASVATTHPGVDALVKQIKTRKELVESVKLKLLTRQVLPTPAATSAQYASFLMAMRMEVASILDDLDPEEGLRYTKEVIQACIPPGTWALFNLRLDKLKESLFDANDVLAVAEQHLAKVQNLQAGAKVAFVARKWQPLESLDTFIHDLNQLAIVAKVSPRELAAQFTQGLHLHPRRMVAINYFTNGDGKTQLALTGPEPSRENLDAITLVLSDCQSLLTTYDEFDPLENAAAPPIMPIPPSADDRQPKKRKFEDCDDDTDTSPPAKKPRQDQSDTNESFCRYCKIVGHSINSCTKVLCYKCKGKGHVASSCRKRQRDSPSMDIRKLSKHQKKLLLRQLSKDKDITGEDGEDQELIPGVRVAAKIGAIMKDMETAQSVRELVGLVEARKKSDS